MSTLSLPMLSDEGSNSKRRRWGESDRFSVLAASFFDLQQEKGVSMMFPGEEIKSDELEGSQETKVMKTEAFEVQDDDENEEDSSYADEIYQAITKYNTNPLELSTFATGGEVEGNLGVPAVHVEGVGRIAYPLCKEQTVTLSGVSSQTLEHGTETVVAGEVHRVSQIDSNLVRINEKWVTESLPKVVSACCKKLGVDAAKMDVKANLYKMLLYEEGGHFKKHRDTEKEPGMFGSLLIQLPAEHEGGRLVVHHEKKHKLYSQDKDSGDKAYYTAFYMDCEHTIEPVTKGRRLVLAFNLVRGPSAPAIPLGPVTAAHKEGCETALVAAAKRWCAEKGAVQKLVLPLAHTYPHTTTSFASLQGTDISSLKLLQDAVDPETKQRLFRVYLALVAKVESGMSNAEPRERHWGRGYGRYNRYGWDEDDDESVESATGFLSDGDVDISYRTASWVGAGGKEDLGSLQVDFGNEVITALNIDDADEAAEGIFGPDPALKDDEGYDGTLEYSYHSAVLVFWPVQRDFEIKLASSLSQAVMALKDMDHASADFAAKLERLLNFLVAGGAGRTWSLSLVLPLLQTAEQVRTVLGLAHKTFTKTDYAAVVVEVSRHGWAALGDTFTALFRAQAPMVMTELLNLLEPHCCVLLQSSASSGAAPDVAVPPEAWRELLQVLVKALLQSTAAHYTRAYEYSSYASPTNADGTAKPIVVEKDWPELSRFVITHCDPGDQETVAAHAGKLLSLHSLNHLLEQLLPATGGVFDGPFQATLRERAVQRCVESPQQPADVYAVLAWVVRGGYTDLVAKLPPALKRLCADHAAFRGLFALPVVYQVMQTDSVLSRELEGLVQARIAAVQPKATPPPFSWRMSAGAALAASDPRVAPFLASDQQSVTLTGTFTGIQQARQWAAQHFRGPQSGVTTEAYGSGRNAGVRLTKNKLAHEAAVRRCAEFETELRGLRKLLRVRDRGAVSGAGVTGGSSSSGGTASGDGDVALGDVGSGAAAGGAGGASEVVVVDVDSGAPAQKKARVEPHIYVIA